MLRRMALVARVGETLLRFLAVLFMGVLLLYSLFSLWGAVKLYQRALPDKELLACKPQGEDGTSLEKLMEKNPDVRGWISVEDTGIDYPIVQGKTDLEYLSKDVYGEYSLSGSIFVDSRNRADVLDDYMILYGHHMEHGAMFGDVTQFASRTYFDTHRHGMLFWQGETHTICFFACCQVDAYDSSIYCAGSFNAQEEAEWLESIRAQALCYQEPEKSKGAYLALSTCAEAGTNQRIILVGKEVLKRTP